MKLCFKGIHFHPKLIHWFWESRGQKNCIRVKGPKRTLRNGLNSFLENNIKSLEFETRFSWFRVCICCQFLTCASVSPAGKLGQYVLLCRVGVKKVLSRWHGLASALMVWVMRSGLIEQHHKSQQCDTRGMVTVTVFWVTGVGRLQWQGRSTLKKLVMRVGSSCGALDFNSLEDKNLSNS